jgi:uncharacterized protein YegP (UPF0339 family)
VVEVKGGITLPLDSTTIREAAWRPSSRSARTNAGKFKAPNGEIIAASQGYETKANAHKGIDAIKTHAPGAKVEDHSG